MANALAPKAPSASEATENQLVILSALATGMTPREVSRRLARSRKEQRHHLRLIQTLVLSPYGREYMGRAAMATMIAAIPEVSRALVSRALRGRPDAIKLLFEATGYHNSKVRHEHSGDITISMNLPRPVAVDSGIVDADVVEE